MVRATRTTKLLSGVAILGLVVFSMLIVLILNSATLVNPTIPIQGGTHDVTPGPTGMLTVTLASNQDQSNKFTSNSAIPRLYPIRDKTITVLQTGNSSGGFNQMLVTDAQGSVSEQLSPGTYSVNLKDEALDVNIPVRVTPGNETTLQVTVDGAQYPLIYSEESGVLPMAGGVQSDMHAWLFATLPIAKVGDGVILEVHAASQRSGYLLNATVISLQPPVSGAEWLELGVAGPVDPVNATFIVLTTWTYSGSVSVHPLSPQNQQSPPKSQNA